MIQTRPIPMPPGAKIDQITVGWHVPMAVWHRLHEDAGSPGVTDFFEEDGETLRFRLFRIEQAGVQVTVFGNPSRGDHVHVQVGAIAVDHREEFLPDAA